MFKKTLMIKKSITLLVIVFLLISIPIESSYAAAQIINKKQDRIVSIQDKMAGKYNCTNFGAMAIKGKTLYGIKTNMYDKASILYKVTNFTSKKRKIKSMPIKENGTIKSMGHANGMTEYKNRFYIATANDPGEGNQIISINSKGVITKRFNLNKNVSSITSFRSGYFILGNGIATVKGQDCRRYYVAKFDGKSFDIKKTFYVNTSMAGQDILYRKGVLYIPTFIPRSDGKVKNNYIHLINIKKAITDGKIYKVKKTYVSKSKSKKTSLYEIESLAFQGKKLYCSVNATRKGKPYDGVYRLKS